MELLIALAVFFIGFMIMISKINGSAKEVDTAQITEVDHTEALNGFNKMSKKEKSEFLSKLSEPDQNRFKMIYKSYKDSLKSQREFNKWLNG